MCTTVFCRQMINYNLLLTKRQVIFLKIFPYAKVLKSRAHFYICKLGKSLWAQGMQEPKSTANILLNITFCAPQKKTSHTSWK